MTQPTPPQPTLQGQPHTHHPFSPSAIRAVVSVCETVGFLVASILALMNHGSDFHNAFIAVFLSFIAHGVNHNAGGSPV